MPRREERRPCRGTVWSAGPRGESAPFRQVFPQLRRKTGAWCPSPLDPDRSVNKHTEMRVAKGPRSHISVAIPGSCPGRRGQGRSQCSSADGRLGATRRTLGWPACSAGRRKPTGWPLCPLTGRGDPCCPLLVPTAGGGSPTSEPPRCRCGWRCTVGPAARTRLPLHCAHKRGLPALFVGGSAPGWERWEPARRPELCA